MFVALVFFLIFCSASASLSGDFGNVNCSLYDSEKRLQEAGQEGNCLPALSDPLFANHFDKCKSNVCFLFQEERPLVVFDNKFFASEKNQHRMQLPFRCKHPRQRHRSLRGVAFNILGATSAGDEYCVWPGPLKSCTWNALVHFAAVMGEKEGYQFAVAGPMLETPQRKCEHFASVSWWDDRLVILGRNVRESLVSGNPILQLTSPFQKETWVVAASVVVLFILVCLSIVYRFHVFRGKSLIATMYFIFMGELSAALAAGRNRITRSKGENCMKRLRNTANNSVRHRETSFKSESTSITEEMSSQTDISTTDDPSPNDIPLQDTLFLTKISVSTDLFQVALISFVAIFSLFYGVAVVNFLFQQQNIQLTKEIEHLTVSELQQYCIMQHTAMEAIWNFRVNPRGSKFDEQDESQIPWKRGHSANECLSLVLDDDSPIQFFVTYELEGTYLIESRASCESVTIFETKESIHHFNSGWLFNDKVPAEKRRQLDRELVWLKISGTLSDLVGGRREKCKPSFVSSITFGVILLPVAFLVLPPLIAASIMALRLYAKTR